LDEVESGRRHQGCLGFLFVRSADQIWLLYLLTAIQLGISGFFFPARNAILPDITTKAELGAANALSSTTWSVMLALGAALGGLVSGIWSILRRPGPETST
jgi:MFS family permease